MPNTLAHIAVQGLSTRALFRSADLKWICIGCVIPDLPWILQRVLFAMNLDVSPYDLRLYAIVQSSLLISLIICLTLSAFSSRPKTVFSILSLNVLLHLLLDSLQTKWANGVHLFAPFSWELLNFELFWPESMPTIILTISGLLYLLYTWRQKPGVPIGLTVVNRAQFVFGTSMLIAYALLPLVFLSGPEAADNHSVKVLRETDKRPGKDVQFDRNKFIADKVGNRIITFAGEELQVQGILPKRTGIISAQGRFKGTKTVTLSKVKSHWPRSRELASVLGLVLIGLMWARSLWRQLT